MHSTLSASCCTEFASSERACMSDQDGLQSLDLTGTTDPATWSAEEMLAAFYGDMPAAIAAFARGAPVRVINTEALGHARHRR